LPDTNKNEEIVVIEEDIKLKIKRVDEDHPAYELYEIEDEFKRTRFREPHGFLNLLNQGKNDIDFLSLLLTHKNHFLKKETTGKSDKNSIPSIPFIPNTKSKNDILDIIKRNQTQNERKLEKMMEELKVGAIEMAEASLTAVFYAFSKILQNNDYFKNTALDPHINPSKIEKALHKIVPDTDLSNKYPELIDYLGSKNIFQFDTITVKDLLFASLEKSMPDIIEDSDCLPKKLGLGDSKKLEDIINTYEQYKLIEPTFTLSCCSSPSCNYRSISFGDSRPSSCPICNNENVFSVIMYQFCKLIATMKFKESLKSPELTMLLYAYIMNEFDDVTCYQNIILNNVEINKDQEVDLFLLTKNKKGILIESKIFE